MKLLKTIKIWLIGADFEVGDRVFWNNEVDPGFTGEYTITTKKDKCGYIGIYNDKKKDRVVPWYYLEPGEAKC